MLLHLVTFALMLAGARWDTRCLTCILSFLLTQACKASVLVVPVPSSEEEVTHREFTHGHITNDSFYALSRALS